jgi:hypothetical protein
MSGTGGETCVLVSGMCTTSAFDTFGELWLCPSGLLRIALGLRGTIRFGLAKGLPKVGPVRPVRIFSGSEIVSVGRKDRRNHWVGWSDIATATLKLGVVEHSLHLTLLNGRRIRLEWPKLDGGFDLLEEELSKTVGQRLAVHRSPLG